MHSLIAGLACATAITTALIATPDRAPTAAERAPAARVWIHFRDKGYDPASLAEQRAVAALETTWPKRSLARRALRRTSPGLFDSRDLPVDARAIAAVKATGARVRHSSRWLNAVSADVDADQLTLIAALPTVSRISPVARRLSNSPIELVAPEGGVAQGDPVYGASYNQLAMINVTALHELGASGQGVIVGILDTGFVTTHQAFHQPGHELQIVAAYDFVNNDADVGPELGDPASQHVHGTLILGTLAAHLTGTVVGGAFDASFILCKTEDVSQEVPAEEDNYVAGLEFAELNGADLTTSSLLYSDWYQQSDLDGMTAVTTIAVNIATENGLICLTAMGNGGHDANPTTSHTGAPADAFDVISCGAVESTGELASFSSDGPSADGRVKPEVLAQGKSVVTVSPYDDVSITTASGTSLSTPLVAGAVACMLSADPSLNVQSLRQRLFNTASYFGEPRPDPLFTYGYGIIDALAALTDACAGGADLDEDGTVDGADLGLMLAVWGSVGTGAPADLNHDGVVNGADLGMLLASWGSCR